MFCVEMFLSIVPVFAKQLLFPKWFLTYFVLYQRKEGPLRFLRNRQPKGRNCHFCLKKHSKFPLPFLLLPTKNTFLKQFLRRKQLSFHEKSRNPLFFKDSCFIVFSYQAAPNGLFIVLSF